jgi:hypothetical protein
MINYSLHSTRERRKLYFDNSQAEGSCRHFVGMELEKDFKSENAYLYKPLFLLTTGQK